MSEEKPQRPGRMVKPKAETGEVKGERLKAKGGSEKQKAESKTPKAVSGLKPATNRPKSENPPSHPEITSSKAEPDSYRVDVPHSEINNDSEPDSYRVDIPHSEIKTSEINNDSEITTPKSEIEHPKSEIPMEVHHHPDLEHKPKPIKEYLLEGLMIFIAVMMGFIAENVREYISDNEHVHQLCTQLVQGLKADTGKLNGIIVKEALIGKSNDTLFRILQQPRSSVDLNQMLRTLDDSQSMWPFHSTGGAIEAIKNELHLKSFSNSGIISYIAQYEGHIELLHTIQDITLQYQHNYLDPFMVQHFTPHDIDAALNRRPFGNVPVRNLSQDDMTQMAGRMALLRINTGEQVEYCEVLKQDATDLLKYVQKHFDVE